MFLISFFLYERLYFLHHFLTTLSDTPNYNTIDKKELFRIKFFKISLSGILLGLISFLILGFSNLV